jgi:hypothetical protein
MLEGSKCFKTSPYVIFIKTVFNIHVTDCEGAYREHESPQPAKETLTKSLPHHSKTSVLQVACRNPAGKGSGLTGDTPLDLSYNLGPRLQVPPSQPISFSFWSSIFVILNILIFC